jgi:hypothetical protein
MQGDQIGRFFAYWALFRLLGDYLLWAVFYYRCCTILLSYFFHGQRVCINLDKKWLGKIWAILLQTHLVTLVAWHHNLPWGYSHEVKISQFLLIF